MSIEVKALYELPTGQKAMSTAYLPEILTDDQLIEVSKNSQPEWTLIGLLKFPDGVNQEVVFTRTEQ
jgi:hypothetical protein